MEKKTYIIHEAAPDDRPNLLAEIGRAGFDAVELRSFTADVPWLVANAILRGLMTRTFLDDLAAEIVREGTPLDIRSFQAAVVGYLVDERGRLPKVDMERVRSVSGDASDSMLVFFYGPTVPSAIREALDEGVLPPRFSTVGYKTISLALEYLARAVKKKEAADRGWPIYGAGVQESVEYVESDDDETSLRLSVTGRGSLFADPEGRVRRVVVRGGSPAWKWALALAIQAMPDIASVELHNVGRDGGWGSLISAMDSASPQRTRFSVQSGATNLMPLLKAPNAGYDIPEDELDILLDMLQSAEALDITRLRLRVRTTQGGNDLNIDPSRFQPLFGTLRNFRNLVTLKIRSAFALSVSQAYSLEMSLMQMRQLRKLDLRFQKFEQAYLFDMLARVAFAEHPALDRLTLAPGGTGGVGYLLTFATPRVRKLRVAGEAPLNAAETWIVLRNMESACKNKQLLGAVGDDPFGRKSVNVFTRATSRPERVRAADHIALIEMLGPPRRAGKPSRSTRRHVFDIRRDIRENLLYAILPPVPVPPHEALALLRPKIGDDPIGAELANLIERERLAGQDLERAADHLALIAAMRYIPTGAAGRARVVDAMLRDRGRAGERILEASQKYLDLRDLGQFLHATPDTAASLHNLARCIPNLTRLRLATDFVETDAWKDVVDALPRLRRLDLAVIETPYAHDAQGYLARVLQGAVPRISKLRVTFHDAGPRARAAVIDWLAMRRVPGALTLGVSPAEPGLAALAHAPYTKLRLTDTARPAVPPLDQEETLERGLRENSAARVVRIGPRPWTFSLLAARPGIVETDIYQRRDAAALDENRAN